MSSVFDSVKFQKLLKNVMYPDDESTGFWHYQYQAIDSEIFLQTAKRLNLSVLTYFSKIDDFKHVLNSSAGVVRGFIVWSNASTDFLSVRFFHSKK